MSNLFVAIEGLDGSGKTTTTHAAVELLQARGIPAWATKEPSGLLGIPCDHEDPAVAALLYAADRLLHCVEIQRHLAAGEVVICDRYIWSSVVVQGAVIPRWFVEDANMRAIRPDLVAFIRLSPDEALRRIHLRAEGIQRHESRDALETAAAMYSDLLHRAPYVCLLDGMDPVEERARVLVEAIVMMMGRMMG